MNRLHQTVPASILAAALSLGCQSPVEPGPASSALPLSPPPLSAALSVKVAGPSVITAKGTYTWAAEPSGGAQEYAYQWEVTYLSSGRHSVRDGQRTQSLTVYGEDGDLQVNVTVTSGALTAAGVMSVTNAIAGDRNQK